jgi:hypothetical protein
VVPHPYSGLLASLRNNRLTLRKLFGNKRSSLFYKGVGEDEDKSCITLKAGVKVILKKARAFVTAKCFPECASKAADHPCCKHNLSNPKSKIRALLAMHFIDPKKFRNK